MKKGKTLFFTAVLAGLGLLAAGSSEARAGFTVSLSGTSTNGSGNTVFNYTASTTANDQIAPGNFFRIYDFNGYIPGSITAPAGWTVSVSATDTPPSSVTLKYPDTTVPNLTFTYTGSTSLGASQTITGFSATSKFSGQGGIQDFVGQTTPTDGSTGTSRGDIVVPSPVPEPTSLISGGIGIILLGLGYRSRRNSSV